MSSLSSRLKRGAAWGLGLGLGYSLLACVLYALRGGRVSRGVDVTLPEVVALYLVAGVLGGSLFGALSQIAVSRWSSALVGIVVTVPVFVGSAILLDEPGISVFTTLAAIVVAAVCVGGVGGMVIWDTENRG